MQFVTQKLRTFRELRRYGARKHEKRRYNYRTINQEDNYMKSVLEELFYGNLCPNTDCRSKEKEVKELMGYIADHHDNLLSTLNDQQKEILEKFDDCYIELPDINANKVKLSEVDSKVTIVYFWNSANAGQKMFNLDVLKSLYKDWDAKEYVYDKWK